MSILLLNNKHGEGKITREELNKYLTKGKDFKVFNDRIMVIPLNVSVATASKIIVGAESTNFPVGIVVKISPTSRLVKCEKEEDRIQVGDIVSYYDRNSAEIKMAGLTKVAEMVPDSDVFCAIPFTFEMIDDQEILILQSTGAREKSEPDAVEMLMGQQAVNARTDYEGIVGEDVGDQEPFDDSKLQ